MGELKMKVEVWQDEVSVSVVTEDDPNTKIWVGDNAKIIRTIEGKDWDDCMKQHHEIMGWETYKPSFYGKVTRLRLSNTEDLKKEE